MTQLTNRFWVIEVFNKKNEIGFIIKTIDQGIMVAIGGFSVKTTLFKTRTDANECITKNKLYRLGKCRIVDQDEIAEKYGKPVKDGEHRWVIKNEEGLYLKFTAERNQEYYFGAEKIGAIVFDDIVHMNEFIDIWQPKFAVSKFIPTLLQNGK